MKAKLLFLFLLVSTTIFAKEISTNVAPPIIPTFNQIGPLCQNSTAPQLPGVSTNGIIGTWTPATINTNFTSTYTFTPSSGQGASTTTMTVQVFPLVIPAFTQIAPLCENSIAPILPNTSANGVTGTWSPNTIDTSFAGNQTFFFTPELGQCASPVTMTVQFNPAPQIISPQNISTCDSDGSNDGYYLINLNSLIPDILGSQNPTNFTVTFYETQNDAVNLLNPIVAPNSYNAFTHTIWFGVINNSTGCYSVSSFITVVEQLPEPFIINNTNLNSICVDFATNTVLSGLSLQTINTTQPYLNPSLQPVYNYQWYKDGVAIPAPEGTSGSTYLINYPLSNNTSSVFTLQMISTNPLGCTGYSQDFIVNQSGPASPIGIGYTIVNNAGNQIITVDVEGYGYYQYSLDGGAFQYNPVFVNVPIGFHTITVNDVESNNTCDPLVLNNVEVTAMPVAAPTGNPIQSFNQGATLADIVVSGQNIQWYANSTGNRSVNSVNSLPLNTILVNGTTYYASQKIGGYESIQRLPVTVQTTLNSTNFQNNTFAYSPNPVIDNLQIKASSQINKINVFNTLGQLVLVKNTVSSNEITVDLSELNSGYYLVKLDSETASSNFKILKQ